MATTGKIHIGIGGWVFEPWRGTFYPDGLAQKRELEYAAGKLTSIVVMIVGISLFVKLAQSLVRPNKVTFACPECALQRHEPDAVHCKACGHKLKIPDPGD